MKRVLCLVDGRFVGASRFRFYQFQDYLERHGVRLTIAPCVPEKEFSPSVIWPRLYGSCRPLARALGGALFLWLYLERFLRVLSSWMYDAVIIQRNIHHWGPPILERLLFRINPRIALDFDDAIYLAKPERFNETARRARICIAGSDWLAAAAVKAGGRAVVVPTVADEEKYKPRDHREAGDAVVVGYVASRSTLQYLALIHEALAEVKRTRPALSVRIFAPFARSGYEPLPFFECVEWSEAGEIEALRKIDIGVMPLPDDEWTRGKCGFKLIQYMTCGVASVASPVGVNRGIIEHGVNGFLAADTAAWVKCLTALIDDPGLRGEMGRMARRTAVERFSVASAGPPLCSAILELASSKGNMK